MKFKNIFGIAILISFISFAAYLYAVGTKFVEPILIDEIDEDIIIVNIGNGNRSYIGGIINKINKYNPKVIGLDAFFLRRNYKKEDTILHEAIENAPVILAKKFHNNGFIPSEKYFSNYSLMNSSVLTYTYLTLAYKFSPYVINSDEIVEHFSISVAKKYDSLRCFQYLSKIDTGKRYHIEYTKLGKNFFTYKYQDTNFDSLKIVNKIVLLGYLGPTDEDKFHTPMKLTSLESYQKEKDTYGIVVLANIIKMAIKTQE